MDMLKELIEYIVKQLVEYSDEVVVTVNQADKGTVFEVQVKESDRGRLIGREGKTIKAIRMLVAVVVPEGEKVFVELAKSSTD